VLADALAAALLVEATVPPVLADALTTALLAIVMLPPVLADALAAALLAEVTVPPVLADALITALLVIVTLPPVLAVDFLRHPSPIRGSGSKCGSSGRCCIPISTRGGWGARIGTNTFFAKFLSKFAVL
jgi:hypothetical protein